MSEYFRRYIKREHYPNPPYRMHHIETMLNLRQPSRTVSMTHFSTESGSKPGMMIGMSFGARRNKSIGSSRNIEFYRIWGSIIFVDGSSCVARICLIKISKNSNVRSTSKIIKRNLTSMTFCLLLFCFLVNMSFFMRNLKGLKMTIDLSGLWNP